MMMNDLVPAWKLAQQYGCKSLVFGMPGTGKTPVASSAPRPLLLAAEPGMLSMRSSTVPTWRADTWARVVEFFDWFFGSNERSNFDTLAIDSASQLCDLYLRDNPKKLSHGLQLYGGMADSVGDYLTRLYYLERMHIYMICKQFTETTDGGTKYKPYFPGKDLNVKVPHLYDAILHIGRFTIPGSGVQPAFHCHSAMDALCRDRSGMLAEYEPLNLTALFAKVMTPVQQPNA